VNLDPKPLERAEVDGAAVLGAGNQDVEKAFHGRIIGPFRGRPFGYSCY